MTQFPKQIFPPREDFRKSMLQVMSEVSRNPANVIPEQQEELAMFMVSELKAFSEESTIEGGPWVPLSSLTDIQPSFEDHDLD